MMIRPSAAIRHNYNEISDFCKKTGEPVYLTKNGEGDLVVIDINAYSRREKMLELRERLLQVELDRLNGAEDCSIEELDAAMGKAILAAKEGNREAVQSYDIS